MKKAIYTLATRSRKFVPAMVSSFGFNWVVIENLVV